MGMYVKVRTAGKDLHFALIRIPEFTDGITILSGRSDR